MGRVAVNGVDGGVSCIGWDWVGLRGDIRVCVAEPIKTTTLSWTVR